MEATTNPKPFGELISSSHPVLVDFFAVWCGPCKMMKPILHELKSKVGPQLTVIQIDVDKSPAIADRYQIQGVPTLMLFKGGKVLWRQSGVMPAAQLQEALQPFLA